MESSSFDMDIDPPNIQKLSVEDSDEEPDFAIPVSSPSANSTVSPVEENERGYSDESYFLPNDQLEGTRQSILHQAFTHFLDRKLMMAHLFADRELRILDVGTGSGDWALAIATKFTSSTVIAADISTNVGSTATQSIPANLHFQVDDMRAMPWTFESSSLDFIHMRGLGGAFTEAEVRSVYGEAYRCLKNGGVLEISDFGSVTTSDSHSSTIPPSSASIPDSIPPDAQSYLSIYNAAVSSAADARGLLGALEPSHISAQALELSQFKVQRTIKATVPLGDWSANRRDHRVGRMANVAMLEGFEARALRLLTRELGWSKEGVRDLCDRVKTEVLTPGAQPSVQCHFIVARKLETD